MQFIYPAVFCQKDDGSYHGYFPDTFELPSVTHPEDLILKEGEFIRNIAVTIRLTDGWDE